MEWDAQGKITFNAPDFNVGDNVTKNANTYSFKNQYDNISLDFDDDGLAIADIESIDISGTDINNIHQCFRKEKNSYNPEAYDVNGAQNKKINLGFFMIRANNNNVSFTLNSVTFTKKKFVFDVTKDRLYFEDFEKLSDASFLDGKNAPTEAPNASQQGKYYLYGGRGKILKDPTFGKYYQNLADADEYTKSLSENFLRYTFTDSERRANVNAIKNS